MNATDVFSPRSSPREVRWERMFPDELERAFAHCPVLYFVYGLCEPHGPQNALGLDALKAHAIACRAARDSGGIVAPPDYWHIHEIGAYADWSHANIGNIERPWLTSVPPWIHFRNVCYQVRAADALGFHAAILLTGHYGPNGQDLKTLVALIQPFVGTRLYALPDFEANVPGFDSDNKSGGDHAGKVETSLLWATEPDCVDVSRFPKDDTTAPHFAMGRTAPLSNRRVGERMVADETRYLSAKTAEPRAEYARLSPEHRFRTFAAVEQVWETVVVPVLPDFRTMQDTWNAPHVPPLPEVSRWRANRAVFLPGTPPGAPQST